MRDTAIYGRIRGLVHMLGTCKHIHGDYAPRHTRFHPNLVVEVFWVEL